VIIGAILERPQDVCGFVIDVKAFGLGERQGSRIQISEQEIQHPDHSETSEIDIVILPGCTQRGLIDRRRQCVAANVSLPPNVSRELS
jgi:hypothetical protein